ncbi:hypothetical protein N0V82_003827 [Gnomoniopsis sp. IMI 355080]|nr:hypothetical protein N0V82_003827 [Gnomoniopsis sp. IMI 355080]
MSISLYDSTVKTFDRQLRNLSAILTKAQQWCDDNGKPHSELLEARLAPDMFPLPYQVRNCTNQARNGTLLSNGTWSWMVSSARPDDEHTFEGLQARIQRTVEWLEGIREQDIEGGDKMPVEVTYSGEFHIPEAIMSLALPKASGLFWAFYQCR